MNYFDRAKEFLLQPYPDKDDWVSSIVGSISAGLIVFAILYILMPFGMDQTGFDRLKYSASFGIISILISFIYDLVLKYVLRIRRDLPSWKFYHWLISIMVLILLIAIGNYLFTMNLFGTRFDWNHFGRVIYATIVVGIFPVFISGTITLITNLKRNLKLAENSNIEKVEQLEVQQIISIPVQNSSKEVEVDVSKILFVEAEQNYVAFHFEHEDGIEKKLIRNTIKNMEALLHQYSIVRCHRSFLVSKNKILKISGNAQGLKLTMFESPMLEVPVSRKYIPIFK